MEGERDFSDVLTFLSRFAASPASKRSKVAADAPLERVQGAALQHPDPFVRRGCLAFLDHHANEESAHVFAQALADPVEPVRHTALHSIACETCRTDDLCTDDVVPHLVALLVDDPSAEVRHKTIPVLLRLAGRDPRARAAVEQAMHDDPDDLVREVASRALAGEHIRARKAYERERRRKTRRGAAQR